MSGLEVVGVVLGILPLICKGLSQYRDVLQQISYASHYREVIQNLLITFSAAVARFEGLSRNLLARLAVPAEDWDAFVNDSSRWNDRGLSLALEQHLGSGHVPFLALLARFGTQVQRFAVGLDLDPTQRFAPRYLASTGSKESFFKKLTRKSNRLFKSIQIGLDNGRLLADLRQMEDDLLRLEKLSPATSQSTTPTVFDRSKEGMWEYIREAVNALFRALSGRWKCKCSHLHRPYLRLDSREAACAGQLLQFSLTLLSESSQLNPSPWKYRSIEIESVSVPGPVPIPSRVAVPSKVTAKSNVKQRKQVRLTDLVPRIDKLDSKSAAATVYSTSTVQIARSVVPVAPQPLPQLPISTALVDCLCSTLQHGNACMFGLDGSQWQHQLSPANTPNVSQASSHAGNTCKPLFEQLLLTANQHKSAPTITVREKYRMAYMLSSSVLQLADSPWLPPDWTLSQLQHFDTTHPPPASATDIQPYASASTTQAPSTPSMTLVPNQTLFSLGVALLELSFQARLADLRKPADLDANGNPHLFTDNLTATRLLKELEDDNKEIPVYTQAVRCCLFGSFSAVGPTFENTAFQDQFYMQVVGPFGVIYKVLK